MSNLNNNTTQLESLLAKVNALPEAGGGVNANILAGPPAWGNEVLEELGDSDITPGGILYSYTIPSGATAVVVFTAFLPDEVGPLRGAVALATHPTSHVVSGTSEIYGNSDFSQLFLDLDRDTSMIFIIPLRIIQTET